MVSNFAPNCPHPPMPRVYHVAVLQMMPLVCLFLSLVVYLRLTGRRSPWFWMLPLVPVPVYVFRILREEENKFGAVHVAKNFFSQKKNTLCTTE